MPKVLQHLLLPKIYLTDPWGEVDILQGDQVLRTYGIESATVEDIENGILFRLCQVLEYPMCDERLGGCSGVFRTDQGICMFNYQFENLKFSSDPLPKK